ncbi:30S ribosomal protein S7 [Salpingoeca rosetta]|uniref:30S ribosomal protein S7 n=1 Tax=Salpingoeca rosetta (strain ATCC 50818 / BSB-021) TaxID=946362 RepID=F2UEZ9_SALR5|nr:30S ribosomal protein S7 [Salpingoeca rosetta]EGD75199.1 30S ribosomal protein S7 [Salpingoeca rosetta]|eukprot:XP_004992252.1 30S ribosomal protein S7 [Salpingoeca rosetta]
MCGKKTTAEKILKNTLHLIKRGELDRLRKERADSIRNANPDADVQSILFEEAEHVDPMLIFREAVSNCMPTVALTPMRKGATVYQVPTPLDPRRRQALAIKWLIAAARKRQGKPMAEKLYTEIMDAYNNQGTVIRRKIETHKMAEANRAYASMRWSR